MRLAVATLVMLFPVIAFASADVPKDKYVKCNCHVTPGVTGKNAIASTDKPHPRHHHKATAKAAVEPPKLAQATPAKHTHHHKGKVASKKNNLILVDEGYPGKGAFVSSNKLPLPAGKSIYAPGELVYISGRVLDMFCVPVSDAVVEIWQADPEGHYVKSSLGERLSPAPTFTGNGLATTDNLGRFNFVTVFPGSVNGRAPFIHVRVLHKGFEGLDTEMFFADDTRNAGDPFYSTLTPQQRSMLTAKVWQRDVNDQEKGLGASWDISLNWKNPWRHF